MKTRPLFPSWVLGIALGCAVSVAPCSGDSVDDALASIGCARSDLAIPSDIRWRDPFRLQLIDRLLAHPLETPDLCQTLAEELANAASLEDLLARAGMRLEVGDVRNLPTSNTVSRVRAPKFKGDPQIQEALDILYNGAAAAEESRKKAFAPLNKADYSLLLKRRHEFLFHQRGSENTEPFDEALLATVRKVDYAALVQAGMLAARATEAAEAVLRTWKPSTNPTSIAHLKQERPLLDTQTPLGRVVVGGLGNDHYDGKPIAILIELGGNDTYRCAVGSGVVGIGLAIDLSGDDTFDSPSAGEHGSHWSKRAESDANEIPAMAFGSGDMGIGILLDVSGDDHYAAGSGSLGSALFGIGALVDRAGMDAYTLDEHGEGAANFGVGLLLDESGDDTYLARYFAQGVAGPLGFGLLLDRRGNDTYFAGGKYRGWSASQDSYRSACQGFAQGIREYASGGIALLVDTAGNDSYRGGAICQGVACWFALGALVDAAGNDTYTCLHYGQGGPFHFGVGALLDNAGDDFYKGDVAAQGMGYDWSAAFLVDYAGNDTHDGSYLACGAGGVNGVGIFCDNAGDDVYRVKGGIVMGSGQWVDKRASGSLGLFLDFAGNDRYASTNYANNSAWKQDSYGAGRDMDNGAPVFTNVLQIGPRPTLPVPWAPDVTNVPPMPNTLDGARRLFEIMVAGLGESARAKRAQEDFLTRRGPALTVLLEAVRQKPFYRCYGLAYSLLPGFGTNALPPLLEMAKDNDPWLRCRAADVLGMMKPADAQAALPALRTGLQDSHFWVRTSCVQALGKLGDTAASPAMVKLLASDPHPAVRVRAAEALGALKTPDAAPALTQALTDPYYHVRYGARKALDATR